MKTYHFRIDRTSKLYPAFLVAWWSFLLLNLAIIVTTIYISIHFLKKLW